MTHFRSTALVAFLAVPVVAFAQTDFVSRDGLCDAAEYEVMTLLQQSGNSVTVRTERIKSGSLAALPLTEMAIPAFTPVRCYAESGDLVLVLSDTGGANYCGWIPRGALLRGARSEGSATAPSDSNVFGSQTSSQYVCPTVRPMSVTQYCEKTDDLNEYEALCEDVRDQEGGFRQNPIETKFLTWNADNTGSGDRTVVPLHSEPASGARMETDLSVFSVMKVWDIAAGDTGIFALVGPNQKSVVGWVPVEAGTVWFSKLTTFFSDFNDAPILTAEPGTPGAEELARRPPNLEDMLKSDRDFDKYPVLVDRRDLAAIEGTTQEPHLKIAFIGATCGDGEICSDTTGDSLTDRIRLLEAVDILFLIDATKSMQEYFAIVANAVKAISDERASTTTRFGAVLYGDYLRRGAGGLDSPMQFRTAVELTEIYSGDEFDGLATESLYISDANRDKPEAAFAALYQAVRTVDWRDESVRFVIHVADHGDRSTADSTLADLMRTERVFYVPIAVRGEYIPQFNNAFVAQTGQLLSRLTSGGTTMGIPTQVTFEGAAAQTRNAALGSILKSLRASTELQEVISRDVTAALRGHEGPSAAASSRYPPGFAQLVEAARRIYGIEDEGISQSIEGRTLAAPGFISLPADGESADWRFQIALDPGKGDLARLIQNFDLLCKSLLDSDSQNDLSAALRSVIEVLTGDILSNDNARFYAYFNERDEIPLVTRTILGDGILDLGRDLQSYSDVAAERVEKYRREACRTSRLLRLMDSDRLVPLPYEKLQDGSQGDLVWDNESQTFNDLTSRPFTWTRIGLYDTRTIYLPLTYLPRPYSSQ